MGINMSLVVIGEWGMIIVVGVDLLHQMMLGCFVPCIGNHYALQKETGSQHFNLS